MKVSAFTTVTYPEERGDLLVDTYGFADELIVVDGGRSNAPQLSENQTWIYSHWPKEFRWNLIGQQFQKGYDAATGDWVLHMDQDFVFHERDYGRIRQALKDYPSAPAISFYKHQMIQPDRYNLKSRLILAVNKGAYGDRIMFNGGGDLCQPTFDGQNFDLNEMPQAGIPFWNYEHLLKTKQQSMEDVGRMDRAYKRHFGDYLYSEDGTDESAFEGWLKMVVGRYHKPSQKIAIHEHPKVMRDIITHLQPEQFGYDGWGNFKGGYFG